MTDKNESALERRHPFFSNLERSRGWEPLLGLLDDFMIDRPRLASVPTPNVDITETDDTYKVRAEIPGVAKGDVSVELEGDLLTIRGEKRSERDEKLEKGRRLECTYGTFSRAFTLPADADADRISAEFKDGVLSVAIGKKAEAKPKQIAVKG